MRRIGLGLVALAALTLTNSASAQGPTDAFPPLPNVLLLVDTSGSMEYNINGDGPGVGGTCTGAVGDTFKSRWVNLTEVLTGTIENYGCYAHDREDADFISEFTVSGIAPYDQGYFLPYHRALSNNCMFTPGTFNAADVFDWGLTPFGTREYGAGLGTACANTFDQQRVGILDTYRDRVRFGLFTFDARPDAGTGLTGANNLNAATGMDGHWSYFEDWAGAGTPATGHPPDCTIPNQVHEVGARNAAAPPWEGRMINFGPVYASLQENRDHNDRVQDTLLALRPYGATPLGAQLSDAEVFFRSDNMNDGFYNIAHGFSTDEKFAPAQDPLLNNPTGSCRDSYIIVLSDGEPNLDMRPYCDQMSAMMGMPPYVNGSCPYDEPWEVVQRLNSPVGNSPPIKTFAIGFGISVANGEDCTTLTAADFDTMNGAARCVGATGPLAACCNLAQIAVEGGTGTALFADDVAALRAALASVLDSVATQSTSRTTPSFVSASADVASNADAVSYEFASAFTPMPGDLWRGNLERKRWDCDTDMLGNVVAQIQPVDQAKGDDFAANVNSGTGPERKFWTAIPDTNLSTGFSEPTFSIRPQGGTLSDGLGAYGAGTLLATTPVNAAAITAAAASEPSALVPGGVIPTACQGPDLITTVPADCAQALMLWNVGEPNGALDDRVGNELGALYHSSPKVIGRPEALTSDASYAVFQSVDATKPSGPRPLVMYAQTVDGQLHAFKVAANSTLDLNPANAFENNEIWSFLPPHALSSIHSMYPNTPQILADGPIAIRDIPFQRTAAEAAASSAAYKTVLVASGGQGGGYYYALDVTDPYNPSFLWQLSRSDHGERMFSDVGAGEPAIAMIAIGAGALRKEVAVAILPGGEGQPGAAGGCPRQKSPGTIDYIDTNTTPSYTPRTNVRCWQSGPARSVTVVVLETGEILRTFRSALSDGPAGITASLVADANLDAPLLGAVAFPNGTGQVANRAYLNDQDGSLWRLDLSDPDPTQWSLDLLFDAYALGDGADDGQPVATLPVISLDSKGNTVILFSTGDQEEFRSTTHKNRVWSLTEFPVASLGGVPFTVESNWYLAEDTVDGAGTAVNQRGMDLGEKVTGPIAVFNEVAYFSTLTPPPASDACAVGTGRIWAVKYVSDDGDKVADPAVVKASPPNDYKFTLADNVNPFGVAVTAEPSCRADATETDDYVGKHAVATTTKAANYVLRFNTGSLGSADTNSTVNIASIDLPEPKTTIKIDSWGSIVE